MPAFSTRHLGAVAAALALTVASPAATASAAPDAPAGLREVMFVGNNWDGTADVIRSTGDFARIGRIDVVPDKAERMAEINADPIKWIYFQAIRNGVGEGHDQLVDDMYSTPDGTSVVVSRPSFADVVSVDLATGDINWRFPVSGYRSDHMAVSPTAPGSRSRRRPRTPCTSSTSGPVSRSARSARATSRTRTSSPATAGTSGTCPSVT